MGSPTETLLFCTMLFSLKLMYARCSSAFCQSPGEGKRQERPVSESAASPAAKAWSRWDLTAVLDTSITCVMTVRSSSCGLQPHVCLCNHSTAYCTWTEILRSSRSLRQRMVIKCCPLYVFRIPSSTLFLEGTDYKDESAPGYCGEFWQLFVCVSTYVQTSFSSPTQQIFLHLTKSKPVIPVRFQF